MSDIKPKGALEAILFSSSEPLSTSKLSGVLKDVDGREVRKLIQELNEAYVNEGRSFFIEEIAGGFKMVTRPEYAGYVEKFQIIVRKSKLTPAALETLALIAHRQPITRAEIEAVRGVQCGEVLRSLIEKRVVKISGRKDVPGKPLLYATTRDFLERFGLKSAAELKELSPGGPVK